MPRVNCAATMLRNLNALLISEQRKSIGTKLAGRSFIRAGQTYSVERVAKDGTLTLLDAKGETSTMKLDKFYAELVTETAPYLSFEKVTASDLNSTFVGRLAFRRGESF